MYDFKPVTKVAIPVKHKTIELNIEDAANTATQTARKKLEEVLDIASSQKRQEDMTKLSVSLANAVLSMVTTLAYEIQNLAWTPDKEEDAVSYTNRHREVFDAMIKEGVESGEYQIKGQDPQETLDKAIVLCVAELSAFYGKSLASAMRARHYH